MPKMVSVPNPVSDKIHEVLPNWAAEMVAPTDPMSAVPYPNPIGPAVSVIEPALAKLGGQQLIDRLMERGVAPELMNAVRAVQRRAPRLLGHISDIQEVPGAEFLGRQKQVPGNPKLSILEINPAQSERGMMSTVHHEAAHAAQNLRGGRTLPGNPIGVNKATGEALPFPTRYRLFNELRGGYSGNPYEQAANVAGVNGADKAMPTHPLTLLRNQLKKIGLLE